VRWHRNISRRAMNNLRFTICDLQFASLATGISQ
jgi:hypothetical protein